ncbi:unnamed protein product, partial [Iphiclides podalirius]
MWSQVHVRLLQQFILASFDLARELQVVPKKIQYVATQERQLYEAINEKFSEGEKKHELLQMMQEVLKEMREEVAAMDWSVDDLPCHQDKRLVVSNSVFYSSRSSPSESVRLGLSGGAEHPAGAEPPCDAEEAAAYDSFSFEDYEIINSNDESLSISSCLQSRGDDAASLISQIDTIHVENESEVFSLSGSGRGWPATATATTTTTTTNYNTYNTTSTNSTNTTCTNNAKMSIKQASLDVQQTVLAKLSRKISLKLVNFVDCLKDTYFGTLQRCLWALEASCRRELGGRPASEATWRLAAVARQVDLQPCASYSLLRSLLDSLRRLLCRLGGAGGVEEACCVLSPVWRRQVALHTVNSLSTHRLARIISGQILERLSVAHEKYQSALASLEAALANRLHHTEDVKLAIRKKYAPAFARLCLESTSMCDLLMYGMPECRSWVARSRRGGVKANGVDIRGRRSRMTGSRLRVRSGGRGQYGVVYAVRGRWAGHGPAAVKSVLPADERHYQDLAMEFFYTRWGSGVKGTSNRLAWWYATALVTYVGRWQKLPFVDLLSRPPDETQ